MKCCLFAGHLSFVTLLLALSPSLLAQSDSELTAHGTVHYSGRHTGLVHIVALDLNDVSDHPDVNNVPFAAHTTIPEPGPYSLTIPHACPGHYYVLAAQMDIDKSGLFSLESFKTYEPSGQQDECTCDDWDPNDGLSIADLLAIGEIDIYLSDCEPLCVLLDTFEADFLSDYSGGMDYHDECLWICQPHIGGRTAVHQVDPDTGELIASHNLGDGHAMSVEWIGDDMWLCCREPASWTVRQYIYDGDAFTQGVSYPLPSSIDWDTVGSVNIAWDGTLLWAQERGRCASIYKVDLSNGSIVEVVSDCDFTLGKWLGLGDMGDICFSDGYLWAMNDDIPTFAKMAPDPNQLPPEIHYTFAFDPNRHVLDYPGRNDDIRYGGMVKRGDLIYFVEETTITDANDTTRRSHRIHTARIEQAGFSWARGVASNAGAEENMGVGMDIDAQSNVYVTGWFDGTNDFGGVTLTSRSGGGQDIFVAKYNTVGVLQWAQRAGGTAGSSSEDDAGRGVGVDAAGNVYVTGQFSSTADFGGINVTAGSSRHCFFLAKYDANGVAQWVRHNASDPNRCCAGDGLAVDASGNCYVVGSFDGATIIFGTTTITKPHSSGVNRYLVKYDEAGVVQWAVGITSTQQSMANSVSLDQDGNIYVAGRFRSDVLVGTIGLSGTSVWNSFIAKLDSYGVPLWAQVITSDSGVQAFGVRTDNQGSVYVSGAFGTVAGTTASFGASVTLTSLGGGRSGASEEDAIGDAFLAKYDAATGVLQWARRAGGTGMDAFPGVSTDAQGNVYTAGGFMSGGDAGGFIVPVNANWHVVAVKYDPNGIAQALDYAETPGGMSLAIALAVDVGGNRYLAGWYQGLAAFGTNVLESGGALNYFLAKLADPVNHEVNNLAEKVPVYRFWSPDDSRHFYTVSEAEKDYLQATYPPNIWTYETVAYYAFADNGEPSVAPVYRFWSEVLSAHFYTIDQAERDFLMATYPDVWAYEGPVFYAYPEGAQPADTSPVYRFWSEALSTHFYTISEEEKDFLVANSPHVWEYETIAWYAYEP